MEGHPTYINARNSGAFTLDGTRTYLVGSDDVAVIDPGPDVEDHVRALVSALEGAKRITIVLTHEHGDHAGAARSLAAATGAGVLGPAITDPDIPLTDGHEIRTDEGRLIAIHTPGHTREHLCFHWPERRALFAGDMILGRGDTTWVAEYPGCVADYLRSLDRLRELELEVIYPAHGPPLEEAAAGIERFESHRRQRIAQVVRALESEPDANADRLLDIVYGDAVPDGLRPAARRSLEALLDYVRTSE